MAAAATAAPDGDADLGEVEVPTLLPPLLAAAPDALPKTTVEAVALEGEEDDETLEPATGAAI